MFRTYFNNLSEKHFVIIIPLILIMCSVGVLFAQNVNRDVIYQTYLESVLKPERFDSYVKNKAGIFNQDFFSCLNRLEKRVYRESIEKAQICNSYSDVWRRQNCHNENHAASILMWIQGFKQVYSRTSRWQNTLIGGITILGKKQTVAILGAEFYKQMIMIAAPVIRNYLICR